MDEIDDCGSCEGQDILDERGYCPMCAHQIDHDPWHIVAAPNSDVVKPGPYPREQAEHIARMHGESSRYSDGGGGIWRAVRVGA